jgi:hypothetical protein
LPDPYLIGRGDELEELLSVVGRDAPGVVVLDGDPGMGRHALLAAACRQTHRPLLPHGSLRLYVETRTSTEGFVRWLRSALGRDAEGEAAPPSTDPSRVAELLGSIAPAVLVLERYRPQRSVDRWLADAVLPALRAAEVALTIAVLDPPATPTRLIARQDLRLTVGPLRPEDVEAGLASELAAARPPVEADELRAYVTAVATRPGIYDSLRRLLALEVPA